jgi:hypothetical protein
MAAPKILPPVSELQKMVDKGMTHAEIASKLEEQLGHKVARSSVSAALSRAGRTQEGNRYSEEIPWKIKGEHLLQYPARMLRLLGRRNLGLPLTDEQTARLDNWLANLREKNLVVAYSETAGLLYVDADEIHDGEEGIPIRRRMIEDAELA